MGQESRRVLDFSGFKSSQLDFAIPQSKIAGLSTGEFVGMDVDDPTNKIKLKVFHCEIINNHEQLKAEANLYKELSTISEAPVQKVNENFKRIKKEINEIIKDCKYHFIKYRKY